MSKVHRKSVRPAGCGEPTEGIGLRRAWRKRIVGAGRDRNRRRQAGLVTLDCKTLVIAVRDICSPMSSAGRRIACAAMDPGRCGI
jgi:hypothetical protein